MIVITVHASYHELTGVQVTLCSWQPSSFPPKFTAKMYDICS